MIASGRCENSRSPSYPSKRQDDSTLLIITGYVGAMGYGGWAMGAGLGVGT